MSEWRSIAALVVSVVVSNTAWAEPLRIGREFRVNTYTTSLQLIPSVGVAGNGDFIVAWQSAGQDRSYGGIFARRFASIGTALDTTDFQVNTYTTDYQYEPSVGVATSGDFVVTWTSYGQDGSGNGIFARRFASTGSPLDMTDFQVNTHTTFPQYRSSVGVASSGDFVVTWMSQDQDGSGTGIFARRFDSSGTSLDATEFLVNTYTAAFQGSPSVGVAPSGDFVVAWMSNGQAVPYWGVFARRFSSTGVALDTAEFQVNTSTTYSQVLPSVSVAPSGDFVVVWESQLQGGSLTEIFARRFASSGVALDTTDFQVNTYTTNSQYRPSVGVTPSGGFVVAWDGLGQDVITHGIFARRFDSAGLALDATDFRVNKHTTYGPSRPKVGIAGSGDFVVAWKRDDQDGSGYEISARQFKDIHFTNPLDGGEVDCRTPRLRSSRPLITWDQGSYDRFRVQVSWEPAFPKNQRITSGDELLMLPHWKPGADEWRLVCNHAGVEIYFRVFGVDLDLDKNHALRKAISDEVAASVLN